MWLCIMAWKICMRDCENIVWNELENKVEERY